MQDITTTNKCVERQITMQKAYLEWLKLRGMNARQAECQLAAMMEARPRNPGLGLPAY